MTTYTEKLSSSSHSFLSLSSAVFEKADLSLSQKLLWVSMLTEHITVLNKVTPFPLDESLNRLTRNFPTSNDLRGL